MQPTQPDHHTPELRRRLRVRARRVGIIRRRVGALTATLFVAAWVAAYGAGSVGHISGTGSVKVAVAHTASTSTSSAVSSGSVASTTMTTSATPVTTRQS